VRHTDFFDWFFWNLSAVCAFGDLLAEAGLFEADLGSAN